MLGAVTTVLAIVLVTPDSSRPRESPSEPPTPETSPSDLTLADFFGMTPDELARVDPLIMNLVILRSLPEYTDIDIDRYSGIVDEWAERIDRALRTTEDDARSNDPAFAHDPNLWKAGGMAVALAGRSIGISYTAAVLDAGDPSQTFLTGLVDTKRGTCSNMPVLYLAIAHRLGWPMYAVVSGDHMWTRWDDGKPGPDDGGSYFNLEATDAESEGGVGSFATPSDEAYQEMLGAPAIAIESNSDFRRLTPRELLAVFLQTRAAYWAAHDRWDLAEHELSAARTLFPKNRDIFMFLHKAMAMRAGIILTEEECREHADLFLALSQQARFRRRDGRAPLDMVSMDRGGDG